ncbi:MAG: sulfatase-like hydrolase/transferase [Clostridium sp.]|nr:sulfatase-like hydrolase/transferase [Clostridium sp.]MCM1398272.1 sulfatase-like hydrolase/transferase [Clostridium sp.]MCM1459064.1 sulfatase-like hydrolase/transferase [Bacteroides sp.]
MAGFITYPLSIIYLEVLFHVAVYGSVNGFMIYPVLFGMAVGISVSAILNLLPVLAGKITGSIIVALFSVYYVVQLIYFKIFGTFLSLVSLGGAENAMNFKSVLFETLGKNVGWLVALFVPFMVVMLLNIKGTIRKMALKGKLIGLGASAVSFLLAVLSLNIHGRTAYSPYSLFHDKYVLELSMNKLGVAVTTARDGMSLLGRTDNKQSFVMQEETEQEKEIAVYAGAAILNADDNGQAVIYEPWIDATIDFNGLYNKTEDGDLKNITAYMTSCEPSYKNEYTGMFQDYNLVFVTAESLSRYGISDTCTPTLYKLMNEGFVFENFYNPIWYHSTIDGEYVNCLSQYPCSSQWSFYKSGETYQPYALGNALNKEGYDSYAYHDFVFYYYDRSKTHPNMGYDFKAVDYGLDIPCYVMYSDIDMVEASYEEFIHKDKFHVYYMTFSGHLPYNYNDNSMCLRNREEAEKLTENMGLSEEAVAYIAAQMELDKALGLLMEKLEEEGKLEQTLFVVTPDHYPYGLSRDTYNELAGKEIHNDIFELNRSCLGIWSASMKEPVRVDKACASVDILPTVLNLMNVSFDSRLLAGRDILSDAEPLVVFADHSFINDKIKYNTGTGALTYLMDEKYLNESYLEDIIEQVENRLYISDLMIDKDYFSFVYEIGSQ